MLTHRPMRHPASGRTADIATSAVAHAVTRGWEPVDEQTDAPDVKPAKKPARKRTAAKTRTGP
jgi:hypothetical protein